MTDSNPSPEDLEVFVIHGKENICVLWSITPTIYEEESDNKIIRTELYDGVSIINGIPVLSKESAYYANDNHEYSPIDVSEQIYYNKLVGNRNTKNNEIE